MDCVDSRQRRTGDVLGCFHKPLQRFPVCGSAVAVPDRDADSEDALHGAAVEVHQEETAFPIEYPGEVLSDVTRRYFKLLTCSTSVPLMLMVDFTMAQSCFYWLPLQHIVSDRQRAETSLSG